MNIFPTSEQYRNPYPFYEEMRRSYPVAFDSQQNLWGLFRYEDVKRVITDYKTFSSEFQVQEETTSQHGTDDRPKTLLTSDPPLHNKLRGLVSRGFTIKAVNNMEPRIESIATDLLNQVIHKGHMELIQDFAAPLPTTVIAEMLDIPTKDREVFKSWADQLLNTENLQETDKDSSQNKVVEEMHEYFREIINHRRENLKEDLISSLIKAEVDGERLTEKDLLSFCELLLLAGHITTVNLIGNSVWSFLENPSTLEEIHKNTDLISQAIEEVLRYRSPIQVLARRATDDVKIGGKIIKKDERIMTFLGSANRDKNQFENANEFNIYRRPNSHIAFGHGIHFCIGAPLARLEARVALSNLFNHMSDLQWNNKKELEPLGSFALHGLKEIPIKFKEVKQHV